MPMPSCHQGNPSTIMAITPGIWGPSQYRLMRRPTSAGHRRLVLGALRALDLVELQLLVEAGQRQAEIDAVAAEGLELRADFR